MPQASERHKRQGGTACRGGDGVPGEQDQPGGEGLRLYGACLLAPAGSTHGAERDHGPGRPHGGRDHGHAMPSEHRPPAPPHRYAAGAGGGRVVPEGGAGVLGFFWRRTAGGAAARWRVRRRWSRPGGRPPRLLEMGCRRDRRVYCRRMKGWTRLPYPFPCAYPTPPPRKRGGEFFPPYIIWHTAARLPPETFFVGNYLQFPTSLIGKAEQVES